MVKKSFFLLFCILITLSLFSISVQARCLSSSDDYAVEVILNKPGIAYNLGLFERAKNVISENNLYILKSRYNDSLAVVVSEVSNNLCKKCLNVKLQLPNYNTKKEVPYFTFLLSSLEGQLQIENNLTFYNNWRIVCLDSKERCQFKKEKIEIILDKVAGKYQAIVETNDNLYSCANCEGRCLHSSTDSFCLTKDIEQEIKDILGFSGYKPEDIFSAYKILDKGSRLANEIQPATSIDLDWSKALKEDLLWLRRAGILLISDSDMEQISLLSEIGKSGQSKIIFGQDLKGKRDWFYEYETRALSEADEDCEEFPVSKIPKDYLAFSEPGLSIYYTLPLFVSIFILGMLLILIIIGRISTIEKKSSQKQEVL